MEAQFSDMSLTELRALAKNKGIKSVTSLRKQELIDILNKNVLATDKIMEGSAQVEDKVAEMVSDKINEPASVKEETSNISKASESVKEKKINKSSIKSADIINKSENPKVEEPTIPMNAVKADIKEEDNAKIREASKSIESSKLVEAKTAEEGKPTTTQLKRNNRSYGEDNKNNYNTNNNTFGSNNSEGYTKRNNHSYAENNKNVNQSNYASSYNTNQNLGQNTTQNTVSSDGDYRKNTSYTPNSLPAAESEQLDSGETKEGILEVMPDGYGFIRCDNYLPGENDVYVSPAQIRRFGLKTGDIVVGNTRIKSQGEKFSALLFVKSVNGFHPQDAQRRKKFEDLTPVFPNERIHLETPGSNVSMRMVDLVSPIGKGQRGMIVSQPKTGKTTLLKQIAKAITTNHPNINLIILLIDERPEEVTDIKESIEGRNVEVIYSTFDELPENHKRVSEMVIERAKRLVEHKKDVVILLDSITRLARAYNLTVQASGRTLSGGLDPAALHMPKRFFGAARNMREGGSLTILATALVDTGSRMDDVVFEEFKGTGNMELMLDRSLSEKRIFPAIDITKSSTRRDDLLLTQSEMEATYLMRKAFNSMKSDDAVERIIDMFLKTKTNAEFIETIKKTKIVF